MFSKFKSELPNLLTGFRIILIPLLIASFYVPWEIANIVVASLFLIAGITDYFDGYFARLFKVQSNFGKCLDPIADKLLVSVALIMLVNFSHDDLYITIPAIIIICREIMVSGMREYLASLNVGLPVTRLAKWKTGIQMMAITALLLAGNGSDYVYNELMDMAEVSNYLRVNLEGAVLFIGKVLLVIASILTVMTGYSYTKVAIKNM